MNVPTEKVWAKYSNIPASHNWQSPFHLMRIDCDACATSHGCFATCAFCWNDDIREERIPRRTKNGTLKNCILQREWLWQTKFGYKNL